MLPGLNALIPVQCGLAEGAEGADGSSGVTSVLPLVRKRMWVVNMEPEGNDRWKREISFTRGTIEGRWSVTPASSVDTAGHGDTRRPRRRCGETVQTNKVWLSAADAGDTAAPDYYFKDYFKL